MGLSHILKVLLKKPKIVPNAENGASAGQIRIVIEITRGCEAPD